MNSSIDDPRWGQAASLDTALHMADGDGPTSSAVPPAGLVAIDLLLTPRPGPPPRTSGALPHQQQSQNAPESLQDELHERILMLPDVVERPSVIWGERSRAYWLAETSHGGPPEAAIAGGEWGHMHAPKDGSLHVALPRAQADQVETAGWGELHPLARGAATPYAICMVFGPRTHAELETILRIVSGAHRHAYGDAV